MDVSVCRTTWEGSVSCSIILHIIPVRQASSSFSPSSLFFFFKNSKGIFLIFQVYPFCFASLLLLSHHVIIVTFPDKKLFSSHIFTTFRKWVFSKVAPQATTEVVAVRKTHRFSIWINVYWIGTAWKITQVNGELWLRNTRTFLGWSSRMFNLMCMWWED